MVRDWYEYAPLTTTGTSSAEIRTNGGKEALIAKVTASFNDSIGSQETDATSTYIAHDGYGYYKEGQNHQPSKKILLSNSEYKADSRGFMVIPLSVASGDSNPTVNGVAVTLGFSDTNSHYLKYLVIPIGNYSANFDVVFGGETVTIEPVSECKYPVQEVQFLNRYGGIESMHFYKAKKESIRLEREEFTNNFTSGTTYTTTRHQIKSLNVRSKKTFIMETGWLYEDYNDTIEELLRSEHVWLNGEPVNVKSSNLEIKTRIVDKLISYSIEFEYAYWDINNV